MNHHLIKVTSFEDLQTRLKAVEEAYLLLYKPDSEISQCALKNIEDIALKHDDARFFRADVSVVRDIHTQYQVTSAPALLYFYKAEFQRTVVGCHNPSFYDAFISNHVHQQKGGDEKPTPRVKVYSTPTCPHCVTLKNHLKANHIRFVDIDISKDAKKAEELVRRSGKQGVPQTEINGRFIIGFDKEKINRLLKIKS